MTSNIRRVANPASALGEAVGKLFESAVVEGLRQEVETRGYAIRPARLTNGTGNTYQIDAVVFDSDENPVIIIDPKYIRYTKHNRDKGSWLCTAHYNLRKTYPSIRKSIAVLAGRWSDPSKALIRSFGVEILEVPFDGMVSVLGEYGVNFAWAEKDRETPRAAWEHFAGLEDDTRVAIASDLTAGVIDRLRAAVTQVLDADITTLPTRISGVEVLLKTDRDEMVLLTFNSVASSLQAMARLVSDRPDISDLLEPRAH